MTKKKLENLLSNKELIHTILNHTLDPIVVVNKEGEIVMLNDTYAEFLGIKSEDVIGKHVTEVIENTRIHIVAKTGVSEIGDIQRIKGHNTICKRIPIREKGQVIGAIGLMMFRDIKELKVLSQKISLLERQIEYYKEELKKQENKFTFDHIIGESVHINELKAKARLVSRTNSTILIRGESGTGKEMFAQAIHNSSSRYKEPFIKVNCAAIPENLIESELFGYEEGAFTGAKKSGKIGKFELANKGTIFLDEIGDMPINMQVKLLRVLQEKEIERVGGNKPIPVDVRIIAATNRPLEKLIDEGEFRTDLYYRLNVVELKILPLRERKEDIPLLVEHFLTKISRQLDRNKPQVTKKALELLIEYEWPGNIRELSNVLERAIIFADQGIIDVEQLTFKSKFKTFTAKDFNPGFNLKNGLLEAEKLLIEKALEKTGGNRTKAAKLLGISRSQLYKKLEKLNQGSKTLS